MARRMLAQGALLVPAAASLPLVAIQYVYWPRAAGARSKAARARSKQRYGSVFFIRTDAPRDYLSPDGKKTVDNQDLYGRSRPNFIGAAAGAPGFARTWRLDARNRRSCTGLLRGT